MIRRSLLVALLLVLGYMLFLRTVKVDWDTTQHLANGNRIKAERFVFAGADSFHTVIVGSSLAYRIDLDSFPPGTANLGFGGMSVHDGLELIVRSGKRPRLVLIESNILFRETDKTFMDALFAPGLYAIREQMPMLREENQPSGVLYGWLASRAKRVVAVEADSVDAPVEAMLAAQEHEYDVLPAPAYQEACAERLIAYVGAVEATGAEVVFFEAPIHARLVNRPLALLNRDLVRKWFPGHRFIGIPEGTPWRTTDGLHLVKADAHRYSGVLARAVERLSGR